MPIYEFKCKKCRARYEYLILNHEQPPSQCIKCGGQLIKVPSAAAIQFKGTGWYVTDYGHKDSGEGLHKNKVKPEETKLETPPATTPGKTGE